MFLVKAHGPRVTKTAACSGFRSYAFFECKRRIHAKAFPARFIVAQDIGDDIRRLRRYDTRDWLKFRSEKLRWHCQSATGKSRVSCRKIDQPDPGIAKNESSTVVVEVFRKIETPFSQFIKRRARADAAKRHDCRDIQRTSEGLAHAYRTEIVMAEVLRVVITVFATNRIGGVGQQGRCGEYAAVNRREITNGLRVEPQLRGRSEPLIWLVS